MAQNTVVPELESKVAPSGSDLYYATRFIAPDTRDDLIRLFYFVDQILRVPFDCSELEVAEAKLNWWQQEIDRTFDGNPQHPASQALYPVIDGKDLAKEYFDEIVTGARMDAQAGRFESYSDLSLYLHRTGSMPWLLASMTCGFDNHMTTKFAHHLGEAIRYLHVVRHTPQLLMAGFFYLPEADLTLGELGFQDFNNPVTPEKIAKQFSYQLARIKKTLQTAIDNLPAEDRQQQKALLIMHRLALHSIEHIASKNHALLESPLELTPLKKAWIAWRTR